MVQPYASNDISKVRNFLRLNLPRVHFCPSSYLFSLQALIRIMEIFASFLLYRIFLIRNVTPLCKPKLGPKNI